MLCLGESIAALVGEIATFKQSLRVKEKQKKGYEHSCDAWDSWLGRPRGRTVRAAISFGVSCSWAACLALKSVIFWIIFSCWSRGGGGRGRYAQGRKGGPLSMWDMIVW